MIFKTLLLSLDIDECLLPNDCSPLAFCKNKLGSYACYCKEGYEGSGKTCTSECVMYLKPRARKTEIHVLIMKTHAAFFFSLLFLGSLSTGEKKNVCFSLISVIAKLLNHLVTED